MITFPLPSFSADEMVSWVTKSDEGDKSIGSSSPLFDVTLERLPLLACVSSVVLVKDDRSPVVVLVPTDSVSEVEAERACSM